jgi:hypothetical protein
MTRHEKEFLTGFQQAALLLQQLLVSPPSFTTREDYVESVAHLHADAQDLTSRGLAVGCLCALGKG